MMLSSVRAGISRGSGVENVLVGGCMQGAPR